MRFRQICIECGAVSHRRRDKAGQRMRRNSLFGRAAANSICDVQNRIPHCSTQLMIHFHQTTWCHLFDLMHLFNAIHGPLGWREKCRYRLHTIHQNDDYVHGISIKQQNNNKLHARVTMSALETVESSQIDVCVCACFYFCVSKLLLIHKKWHSFWVID